MKQLLQYVRTGETAVVDVPTPAVGSGQVLVRSGASLVSAGTERMVVDFARKSLLQKARSRPDLVRQTIDKARREGVLGTIDAVQNRLDQPMALGYSSAGTVIDVGSGISEFQIGDRVACAGGGYAVHAEVVAVPRTLVVKLPDQVSIEAAAFTTLGAIALQGIRLADVKLGEVVAVIGLGLLGQLTVQMLKAAGCIVIGIDLQPQRVELAQRMGADAALSQSDEFIALCQQFSNGYGADATLITADTKSDQPVELAGEVSRDKSVVVAVGAVGTQIPRKTYYQKEIDFRISRSYGPGRYDPAYEDKGQDYPYAYVRWTEQRNMQAFVQLLAEDKVNVEPLITHRFAIEDAPDSYDVITGKSGNLFMGVLLTYTDAAALDRTVALSPKPSVAWSVQPSMRGGLAHIQQATLGVLGAGNFANATLLPAIKDIESLTRVGIASNSGLSSRASAERFGFMYCTTNTDEILRDPNINTVAILTRHHLHARQVIAALVAGKHVFVEKPLCLNGSELNAIQAAYAAATERAEQQSMYAPALMVGFNRRFAPFIVTLKQYLDQIQEPLILNYRVNAGYIPREHWVHDLAQGGGRLLGEGCHFIDLLLFLAGRTLQRVLTRTLPDNGRYAQDNLVINLEFADGSIGTITYAANGDKGFGKEYLEVFGGGLAARMEDFRKLEIRHNRKRLDQTAALRQDKGHRAEWRLFVEHLIGKAEAPMSFDAIVRSTEATLAAQRSLQIGAPVDIEG